MVHSLVRVHLTNLSFHLSLAKRILNIHIVDKVFSLRTALFHRAIKAHLFETLAKDLTPCKLDSCSEIYSFDQISIRHFT